MDWLNFARRSTVPRDESFGAVLGKCLAEEATLRKRCSCISRGSFAVTFDGFPRIICSIRVGIDAGTEMHEGKLPTRDCRRRARVIGKRPSYAPGLLCRLRGLSPGARPADYHFRAARPETLGRIPACPRVLPCARGCGKTYDVFDPRSRKSV